MPVPPFELESLLADDRWIRRLAGRLVADPTAAEDLVQETWVAALTRGAVPSRPWLGRVLRNTWKDLLRGHARRDRRERAAARTEATEPADELVAELELRERLARALRELEEPYRRALYLRFFRGESLAAIARREEVAVSTAHERIERGLEHLRRRLDAEHGGRRSAWAGGLITLARRARGGPGTIEVATMTGAAKIAASILVLVAGVAWWWSPSRLESVRVAPSLAGSPAEDPQADALAVLVSGGAAREPLAPDPPAVSALSAEDPARIVGRVVDVHGRGVAGARIAWLESRDGDQEALSSAEGAFEVEVAERERVDIERIACVSPELLTLIHGTDFGKWTVVVAPRASFAGRVVDESGAPVAGAELAFHPSERLFREVGMHALGLDLEAWKTTSDAQGHFELADVAGGPNVQLVVRVRGFSDAEVALPECGERDMLITLTRRTSVVELTGIVLDPAGAPVPGASVSAGKEIVTTDAGGRFTLLWDGGNGNVVQDASGTWREEGAEQSSVIALKTGFAPAQESLRERELGAPFVLRLGPASLSITGFVLDPEGQPLPGIVLWVGDPTRFGRDLTLLAEGTQMPRLRTVENQLCERSEPAAITDSEARFELGCLMARSYSALAFDPRTSARCGPWQIEAGARDVELVFQPEPMTRVAGRIVSARGEPRPGLEITPKRTQRWGEGDEAPQLAGAEYGVTTDAEGRFAFERLATTGTSLFVAAPPFAYHMVALEGFNDLAHLELVEPELCEVQIELAGDAHAAEGARVLDASGAELELNEVAGGGRSVAFTMETEVQLVDGRSRLLFVPETATTLVLYKAGVEVLCLPVQLEPGQRTVLRP